MKKEIVNGVIQAQASDEATFLLAAIKETDGMEVERDDWPTAEALVAMGLITLGPARGPGGNW